MRLILVVRLFGFLQVFRSRIPRSRPSHGTSTAFPLLRLQAFSLGYPTRFVANSGMPKGWLPFGFLNAGQMKKLEEPKTKLAAESTESALKKGFLKNAPSIQDTGVELDRFYHGTSRKSRRLTWQNGTEFHDRPVASVLAICLTEMPVP